MQKLAKKLGIIGKVKQIMQRCRKKYELLTEGEILIQGGCVRVPCSQAVVEVCLGGMMGKTLQFQPDLTSEESGDDEWPTYWVVDMDLIATGVGGFLRLRPKQNLVLGRHAQEQNIMFDYSTQVAHHHLSVLHQGEYLQMTDLGSVDGTCIRLLPDPERCLLSWRRDQLQRLSELFCLPTVAKKGKKGKENKELSPCSIIHPLPADEAMERLLQAHKVLLTAFVQSPMCAASTSSIGSKKKDKTRKEAIVEAPAVVHLSANTIPVVVGDLHAKVDNLITILTTGCLLTALENGTATLVFLGDAVHPDETGQLDKMDGSMLMMDLILTLMSHFPGQVVYLRGNHDGFSEEIYKGQVCQGHVWSRALVHARGKAYRNAMKAFYRDLPFVAVHPRLLAVHAAPPVVKVAKETLANLRRVPELIHQLTWNRMHQPSQPGGYRGKDVENFRRLFDLPMDIAFVVGHTSMDDENTAWLNAGGMEHHHVLYSGLMEQVGWMVVFPTGLVHMECAVVHQLGMSLGW